MVQCNWWENLGSGGDPPVGRHKEQPQVSHRTVIGTETNEPQPPPPLCSLSFKTVTGANSCITRERAGTHAHIRSAKRKTLIFTMHVNSWNTERGETGVVCMRAAANPAASRNHISPLVTSCYIMLIFAHQHKTVLFCARRGLDCVRCVACNKIISTQMSCARGTTLHTRLLMDCGRVLSGATAAWHSLITPLCCFFALNVRRRLYLASSANWFLCSEQMRARLMHRGVGNV